MEERPFSRFAIDQGKLTWALFISIALFSMAAFLATFVISDPWQVLVFVLTGDGWPNDADGNPQDSSKWLYATLSLNAAVVVPVLILLFGVFKRLWRNVIHYIFLWEHSIVCGVGWQGQAFVRHLKQQQQAKDSYFSSLLKKIFGFCNVVVVELDADDAVDDFCNIQSALLVKGNAEIEKDLAAAYPGRARRVYICAGTLDRNLRIVQALKSHMKNRHRKPLQEVSVSMGDVLPDEAASTEMFASLLRTTDECHFTVYDPDRRMARCFYHKHRVFQWADEQARESGQTVQVHLVFIGFSRLAAELILQYSRIWPCADHSAPVFTVVCRDRQRVNQFSARHPCLTDPASSAGTLIVADPASDELLLDLASMEHIAKNCPVTAVICCSDHSETSLQRASTVRLLSAQHNIWRVPTLVEIDKATGTSNVLSDLAHHPDPAERVIPFGAANDYCDVVLLEQLSKYAKTIHADYVDKYATTGPDNKIMPAFKEWDVLDPVFQRNNQRAADHIPVKLYSLGYRWNGLFPVLPVDVSKHLLALYEKEDAGNNGSQVDGEQSNTPEGAVNSSAEKDITSCSQSAIDLQTDAEKAEKSHQIEKLARLEHKSWVNERVLDGWIYDDVPDEKRKRFDKRKRHKDIRPWNSLQDADKAKDRSHVTVVIDAVKATEKQLPTASKPLRIAFIGHNNINHQQAVKCRAGLQSELKQLIERKIQNECVTKEKPFIEFITPLAPGSDIVLAKAAVGMDGLNDLVSGYRLLIPLAVPWDEVDEDFKTHWAAGNQFYNRDPGSPEKKGDWKAYKERLANTRQALFARIHSVGQSVNIINLMPEGDDILSNHQGYIDQAKWMVNKSDFLIAVLDQKRGAVTAAGEWRSGGTAMTVAQWNARVDGEHRARAVEINPGVSER